MKVIYNVPSNLYIDRKTIEKMENGESGVGCYYPIPDSEVISRYALQPVDDDDYLGNGWYKVHFICK